MTKDRPPGAAQPHAEHVRSVALSSSAAARSRIAASWARSMRAYGLEPDTRTGGERLEWSDLTRRREELGRIRSTSAPVMDRLYASLGLAGCSVFLSDVQGVVIDHRMADADEEYFSGAGLCEGGDWSEAAQGTNGIGTCIVEQRTVTIYRDQHFRDSNTVMSCMGAPVFDESGGLAAVL
ncbi:MAG: GAF domain-containing protein, partial [Hyphomonas sp.]|nr:GAF domain-containing protein [Hyphomonas sp.]